MMKSLFALFFLLFCVLAIQGCSPRQSAVRAKTLGNLKGVEQALKLYQREHEGIPVELSILVKEGLVTEELISEFTVTPTPKGNVIHAKKPFRAVKKGDAWGGLGDIAEEDIPSAVAVLFPGQNPVAMPESEFRQAMKAHAETE